MLFHPGSLHHRHQFGIHFFLAAAVGSRAMLGGGQGGGVALTQCPPNRLQLLGVI